MEKLKSIANYCIYYIFLSIGSAISTLTFTAINFFTGNFNLAFWIAGLVFFPFVMSFPVFRLIKKKKEKQSSQSIEYSSNNIITTTDKQVFNPYKILGYFGIIFGLIQIAASYIVPFILQSKLFFFEIGLFGSGILFLIYAGAFLIVNVLKPVGFRNHRLEFLKKKISKIMGETIEIAVLNQESKNHPTLYIFLFLIYTIALLVIFIIFNPILYTAF